MEYLPLKYFKGLSAKKKTLRKKEIKKFGSKSWRNASAYKGFATDKGIKTKKSHYTSNWQKRFPEAKSLKSKAKATGVPLHYVEECYNRGLAAWRTGHRPGATQQQWGYARVHSFLLCGKTHFSADADLVRGAKAGSKRALKWWSSVGC